MSKKIFLSTLVMGGTLFAFFSLFLATQGSKGLEIEVENQQVFEGKLKDAISPSVGALFSIGLGISTAAVLGWGKSLRQNSKMEQKISNLQKLVSQKELEIEDLRLSPSNLKRTQLDLFLESTQTKDVLERTSPVADLVEREEIEAVTKNNFIVLNTTSVIPTPQSVIGLQQKVSSKVN